MSRLALGNLGSFIPSLTQHKLLLILPLLPRAVKSTPVATVLPSEEPPLDQPGWLCGDQCHQVPPSTVASIRLPNERPKSAIPSHAQEFCLSPVAYAVPLSPAQRRCGATRWAGAAAPVSPGPSCICGRPAPREEEESREEVAGGAAGGAGHPGGLVPPHPSPSHPVLVVLQGRVGSPAVLEELGVWRCPRARARGQGTRALALQAGDSR